MAVHAIAARSVDPAPAGGPCTCDPGRRRALRRQSELCPGAAYLLATRSPSRRASERRHDRVVGPWLHGAAFLAAAAALVPGRGTGTVHSCRTGPHAGAAGIR